MVQELRAAVEDTGHTNNLRSSPGHTVHALPSLRSFETTELIGRQDRSVFKSSIEWVNRLGNTSHSLALSTLT